MRRALVLLGLLGCQGEQVQETTLDAAVADTTPDTPVSDAWPPGSTVVSPGCGSRPGPKMVRLDAPSPFCIDTTEVTNAQYDVFLASAKPAPPSYCFTPAYGSSESAVLGPNRPRTNVAWCAAFQYCAWAGKRLCGKIGGGRASFTTHTEATEAQWSYACRQGSKNTPYPYGGTKSDTACVVTGEVKDVASRATCVGESAPFNQIFDLSGNVSEWIDACDRYEESSAPDGRACARRGGFAGSMRADCDEPQISTELYKSETLGFRCCGDL